ncbi:biotin attachment protein [candidate division KSB3 bacterium]|uniref:Biotin attachment protein n=1 Tax=candidate division KSB3 bacterium TaxID=2044937 RepID=A0A2G6E3F1_9BACT|nr:MAG: biotin attachment protein [candidate division KSB3 bacterium]PIE28899.1 MAG: biotin attachment protein [candidate division KSB3 bacterium]
MTKHVIMPLLGETMEEGTIVAWTKNVGDKVEKGDVLLEVESDKATLEVEAFFSGYVRKILHQVDAEVKVGETIALMTTSPDEPLEE